MLKHTPCNPSSASINCHSSLFQRSFLVHKRTFKKISYPTWPVGSNEKGSPFCESSIRKQTSNPWWRLPTLKSVHISRKTEKSRGDTMIILSIFIHCSISCTSLLPFATILSYHHLPSENLHATLSVLHAFVENRIVHIYATIGIDSLSSRSATSASYLYETKNTVGSPLLLFSL